MADEMEVQKTTEPAVPAPASNEFTIDAGSVSTVYTNFCRVMMTPEELVLDFGLNPHLVPDPTEKVKLTHRVVMNFYTAKRLLNALANVVSQHESGFGTLELDFQRRTRKV
jgi:hypothetical protein